MFSYKNKNIYKFTNKKSQSLNSLYSYSKTNQQKAVKTIQNTNDSNKISIDSLLKKARVLNNYQQKLLIEKPTATPLPTNFQNINQYKIIKQDASIPLIKTNFTSLNQETKLKKSKSIPKIDINVILGRKVNNISKNKFKFIKKSTKSIANLTNLLKIDNRCFKNREIFRRNLKLSNQYSKFYNKSNNIVNIKGVKYNLNKNGNKLKRLKSNENNNSRFKLNNSITKNLLNNVNSVQNVNKILEKVIASNLVQRSIITITRNKVLNNKLKKINLEKKYCKFYNLFGRCCRGDACSYVHDPKRVAICQRFLRGICNVESCPFSHTVSEEKIPLCSFYAAGNCNREKCPYLHIFHGKNAKYCEEFAKGYCKMGNKCNKAHLTLCPDYLKNKSCPRGSKCPLMHRKLKQQEREQGQEIETNDQHLRASDINLNQNETINSDINQSSFISIKDNTKSLKSTSNETKNTPLKIRPTFRSNSQSS